MTEIIRVREARMTYGPQVRPKPAVVAHSGQLAAFLRAELGDSLVERFAVVALDSRHRPQAWGIVATGHVCGCPVSVAEILRFVLLAGCERFIVSHNHPSGDPTPSDSDVEMTRRLVDATKIVGLTLLDHVIVADGSEAFSSFVDLGLLSQ